MLKMNVESNWRILKWTHTHVDGRMDGWMDGTIDAYVKLNGMTMLMLCEFEL